MTTLQQALSSFEQKYSYPILSYRMNAKVMANEGRIELFPKVHVYPFAGNIIDNAFAAQAEFKQRIPVFVRGKVEKQDFERWHGDDENWQTYGQGRQKAKWGWRSGEGFQAIDIEGFEARAVLMADVQFLPGTPPKEGPLPLLRVVHAFGLNFESKVTRDYFHFIDMTPEAIVRKIDETNKQMWEAVLRAAVEEVPVDIPVHVRIPAIGLGEYKRNPPVGTTFERLMQSYVNQLKEAVAVTRERRENLSVSLCIFGDLYNQLVSQGLEEAAPGFKVLSNCNLFDVSEEPTINVNGKQMRAIRIDNELRMLVAVNAWDTNSWIGNGMVSDPTVDGAFVADAMIGGTQPNKNLQNTSFLMNLTMLQGVDEKIKVHTPEEPTTDTPQGGAAEHKEGPQATSGSASASAATTMSESETASQASGGTDIRRPPPPGLGHDSDQVQSVGTAGAATDSGSVSAAQTAGENKTDEGEIGGTGSPAGQSQEGDEAEDVELKAVFTEYYQINGEHVEALMSLISDTREEDGCILYELLNDILTGLGEFEMNGKAHGSAKWLDIFAHLAQRVMENPADFSADNCPETVAKVIGCQLGDDDAAKKAKNMLREPVLRVIVENATMDQLVNRDMEFKRVEDGKEIQRHRSLLEGLKQAAFPRSARPSAASTDSASEASSDEAPESPPAPAADVDARSASSAPPPPPPLESSEASEASGEGEEGSAGPGAEEGEGPGAASSSPSGLGSAAKPTGGLFDAQGTPAAPAASRLVQRALNIGGDSEDEGSDN